MLKKEINSKGNLVVKHYKKGKVDQITEITNHNPMNQSGLEGFLIGLNRDIRKLAKAAELGAVKIIKGLKKELSNV
ncbi:hypothetical protein QYM39_06115 [Pediococcus pentosaceus]|uniref:hypothetical protein n=1 Tax=Pediococcus pentosaceus TaxID=1255 RepID=UPI00265AC40C|nr:hypothetical protein [Pediococcus pentosaceus]WKF70481.1 hypothetical protein QYM39_06115 [Pediococcus pentosaceus]